MSGTPQVLEAIREVADVIDARLQRWGCYGVGQCLPTAALAAYELRRRGWEAMIQAGAGFWRRTDDPADEFPMHGYAYAPDTTASRFHMLTGGMPEFHAWLAVPGCRLGGEVAKEAGGADWSRCHDGFIVDYSARWFPDHALSTGRTWAAARPPHPFVNPCGSPLGADRRHHYEPHIEACRFAGLAVRRAACRLMRHGFHDAEDLFDPCGGPRRPEGRHLDYTEAVPSYGDMLLIVRHIEERRTGRKHVPGSTSVGVWS